MSYYISVQNLVKKYGELCAVDNLSFSVNKGEIFGLLGPNGAGKSTTLSVLTTLSDFNKGEIILNGLDIRKDKMEIKQLIGMVPQDIAVYDHLNALENVKFFASLYGLKGRQLTESAKEALEFVGLSDKQSIKPKHMSGGMKRRLNIACGIAHAPQLIVMDEPTVGVDTQSREHILNSIKVLRDRGATVIYTSHYMNEVEEICDRIAIIDKGQMVACGTKAELVSLVTDVQSVYIETKLPIDFNFEEFKKKQMVMPGMRALSLKENIIRMDITINHNHLSKMIEQFLSLGLPVININTEVPNLDTMFLTLTGHELR
ncbi:ABC transporter ATP-binding protein [Mobilitalea sibirica]|uniref:ABC transporter ATP-binding protein n=1 Tax=Mobilitalea sibirica TaxID=1462919 RepID=A0A8J7HBE2_9FIRM|nr:ABC transporter ATP-binding protein [Mobilitalea sibirica]MBH1940991.1 ABC transporter ATP-binding protein [Mobilitalea sibirica]